MMLLIPNDKDSLIKKREEIYKQFLDLSKIVDTGKCNHPKTFRYEDSWAGECCGICYQSYYNINLDKHILKLWEAE